MKPESNPRSFERRKNIGCYVESRVKAQIERAARRHGLSISAYMAQILERASKEAA